MVPANKRRRPSVGLLLGQRRLMFAGGVTPLERARLTKFKKCKMLLSLAGGKDRGKYLEMKMLSKWDVFVTHLK